MFPFRLVAIVLTPGNISINSPVNCLFQFEEDVQSLQKSLAESQYECASAKEQAAELQETVHKLESECSAAKEEATELQSEVDKLESLLKVSCESHSC